ncbi:MAG: hypothetical protein ABWY11_03690 [Umezawaea sp.]
MPEPGEHAASPSVAFGTREAAFGRPDAEDVATRLVAGVADAIADVFGDHVRAGVEVEPVGTRPDARVSAGRPSRPDQPSGSAQSSCNSGW